MLGKSQNFLNAVLQFTSLSRRPPPTFRPTFRCNTTELKSCSLSGSSPPLKAHLGPLTARLGWKQLVVACQLAAFPKVIFIVNLLPNRVLGVRGASFGKLTA